MTVDPMHLPEDTGSKRWYRASQSAWTLVMGMVLVSSASECGGRVLCDCGEGPVGLAVTAGQAVTAISLSGTACDKGRFRCLPEKFDNKIHGECKELQIEAESEGTCIVELTVGGATVRIEREMVLSDCRCYELYYEAVNRGGTIDLRAKADGGQGAVDVPITK